MLIYLRRQIALATLMVLVALLITVNGFSQSDSKKDKIVADAEEAKAEFIKADPTMADLFATIRAKPAALKKD